MASGISTKIFTENPNERCDRLKLLLQKKQSGKNSSIIDGETIAIADKLSEYKCISTKQHNFLLPDCLDSRKNLKLREVFQNVTNLGNHHLK